MKTYQISKSSWHYRLAHKLGSSDSCWKLKYSTDMCEYVGLVLRIFTWAFIAIAIAVLAVIFFVITPVLAGFQALGWGSLLDAEQMKMGLAFLAAYAFCIIVFGGGCGIYFLVRRLRDRRANDQPSFASMVYRRFKEKSCAKIEIVD